MEYMPFDAKDWYYRRESGAVYATRRGREMTAAEAEADEEYQAWLTRNAGWVPPYPAENGVESRELLADKLRPDGVRVYPLSLAEIQNDFTEAVQAYLDGFARTRNYDGILSAASYATSKNPRFAAEGQYAVEARDAVWAKGYEIMGAVLAGERPLPTLEEVLAELPALAWPEEV